MPSIPTYEDYLSDAGTGFTTANMIMESMADASLDAPVALAMALQSAQISAMLAVGAAIREQTEYMKANDARVFGEPVETIFGSTSNKECVCD